MKNTLVSSMDTYHDVAKEVLIEPRKEANLNDLMGSVVDALYERAGNCNSKIEWRWTGNVAPFVEVDVSAALQVLEALVEFVLLNTCNDHIIIEVEMEDVYLGVPNVVCEFRIISAAHSFTDFRKVNNNENCTELNIEADQRFNLPKNNKIEYPHSYIGGETGIEMEPGCGSVVWFRAYFPISSSDRLKKCTVSNFYMPRLSLRILLVGSSEDVLAWAKRILEIGGNSISAVRYSAGILEKIRFINFDLIICESVFRNPELLSEIFSQNYDATRHFDVPILVLPLSSYLYTQDIYEDDFRMYSRISVDILELYAVAVSTNLYRVKAILRLRELESFVGINKLQPLIARFVQEVDNAVVSLKEGKNHARLFEQCQKLMESSAMFGAIALLAILKELTCSLSESNLDEINEGSAQVEEAWRDTRPVFEKYLSVLLDI